MKSHLDILVTGDEKIFITRTRNKGNCGYIQDILTYQLKQNLLKKILCLGFKEILYYEHHYSDCLLHLKDSLGKKRTFLNKQLMNFDSKMLQFC